MEADTCDLHGQSSCAMAHDTDALDHGGGIDGFNAATMATFTVAGVMAAAPFEVSGNERAIFRTG